MSKKTIKILLLLSFFLSSTIQANNSWTLSKEEDGIKVYVRDTPGFSVQSFRGVITLPDRLVSALAVIEDIKAYPQLLHKCKSARTVTKVSETESIKYLVTDMPWPVKDRDTIVHSVLTQNKGTKQVQIQINAVSKGVELQPDMLRVTKMKGSWQLTPQKNGVTVAYEMNVDPGGSIPKWLVNTMAVDMPFNTLKNLQRLVKKAEYQKAKRSYILE